MSSQKSASLADLLSKEVIEQLALPSNIRYGSAIFERHAVELIEYTPHKIESWAGGLDGSVIEGGGSRRRVQLVATPEGLTWNCTGNPKNHQIFCKHCVAVAMAILNKRIY